MLGYSSNNVYRYVQSSASATKWFKLLTVRSRYFYFNFSLYFRSLFVLFPTKCCFIPASSLCKSIAGRYQPVSYPDGPITARYIFIKNAYWVVVISGNLALPGALERLFCVCGLSITISSTISIWRRLSVLCAILIIVSI